MSADLLGYVQIAQAFVIVVGTIVALCHYRGDIRQRTFRDSLAMEASLRETRDPLMTDNGANLEVKLLAHLHRLEIIASALNKRYLTGIAKEFAEDVLKNDLSGILFVVSRDGNEWMISRFVTSEEAFSDIAKFYAKHRKAIQLRALAIRD